MKCETENTESNALTLAMSRRRIILSGLAFGLALPALGSGVLPVSAETVAGTPKRGGVVKVGLIVPTGQVDPVMMSHLGAVNTVLIGAEYLTFPKTDFSLEGRLATSWRPNAADEWIFELRKGVLFHTGQEMTSADVVATFERLTDPASNSAAMQALGGILSKGGTTAVDTHTVKFKLDRPYLDFPYLVSAFSYNTAILPRDYQIGQFTERPVGTGPYMLESFTVQSGAVFVRNPKYWDPELPYVDRLEVLYFADANAQILALQSGSIDIIPTVEPAAFRMLVGNADITLLSAPSSSMQLVHMRTDAGPFADKRVRQALALAVDREQLISALLDGRASVGNDHLIFPTSKLGSAVAKRVEQRARNTTRAKELLAEAGYPNGMQVELTTSRLFECVDHAALLQQMGREAGFDIKLNIMTPDAYFAAGDNSPWLTAPFGITNWGSRGTPAQLIQATMLSSSSWNSAHFKNAEFDELAAVLDSELDQTKLENAATRIAQIMVDQTPAGISYFKEQVRVTSKRLAGMPAGPGDFPDFRSIWVSA